MKLKEFVSLFPNADMRFFHEKEGTVVFKQYDDVEYPVFWEDETSVGFLRLPKDGWKMYKTYKREFLKHWKSYTLTHPQKRKVNTPRPRIPSWDSVIEKYNRMYLERYKKAHPDTSTSKKVPSHDQHDKVIKSSQKPTVTSDDTWGPKEWDTSQSQTPEKLFVHDKNHNIDFSSFRVYVAPDKYFVMKGTIPNYSDITSIDFSDPKNVYCLGMRSM